MRKLVLSIMFFLLMVVMATCSMSKVEPIPAPTEARVGAIAATQAPTYTLSFAK